MGALQAALSSTGHSPGMGRRRQAMRTSLPTLACPASCGSTTLTMALAGASNTWWKSGMCACLPLYSPILAAGGANNSLLTVGCVHIPSGCNYGADAAVLIALDGVVSKKHVDMVPVKSWKCSVPVLAVHN